MAQPESAVRRKPRFRERKAVKQPETPQIGGIERPPPPPPPTPRAPRSRPTPRLSRRPLPRITYEGAAYAGLVALAFALHIWDVGSRAMHGDEAVHAWFSWQLYNGTGYSYDPVYHGPLQFLVTAAFFFLFGVSNTTGRLMAVLFGTALIFLPYFLRHVMGRSAALLAAAFITISPSLLYDSRLERDDIFTAFFAMTAAIALFGFMRTRRVRYVYIFAASMALSLTAMENTYITLFVFVTYGAMVVLAEHLAGTRFGPGLRAFWSKTGSPGSVSLPALGLFFVALLLAFALTVWRGWYPPVPLVLGLGLVLFVHRQALLGSATVGEGSLLSALRSVTWQTWLNALTIVAAILFLCFSTFGSNLHGIWDSSQPFLNNGHCTGNSFPLNPCRKDIVGGLFYWLSQHKVARGGQPWFYYTFLYGLYEQIALVFGLAGVVWFLRRPRPFTTFLIYWAVLSFGIYSWAGEKFPWLTIHSLLPFLLLSAMFVVDMLRTVRIARYITLALLLLLGLLEIHNAYEVNYVNGADPVEMMVYVQSSPDTPKVASDILSLSNKVTNGPDLKLTIDTEETWPFAWYLRGMPNAAYVSSSQLASSPYSTNPVILVDEAHQPSLLPKLHGAYTGHRYRLRWWFPEDYKLLTWPSFFQDLVNPGYWGVVKDWMLTRRPFGPKGAVWFYYYVKNGLAVPY